MSGDDSTSRKSQVIGAGQGSHTNGRSSTSASNGLENRRKSHKEEVDEFRGARARAVSCLNAKRGEWGLGLGPFSLVVAMISGPHDGVVAEPFCRFSPYPVEGASLTRDEDVGAS